MITQVNGVEITPRIATILKKWYDCNMIENSHPYWYENILSRIQDYLTRILVSDAPDKIIDEKLLKEYIGEIIYMKDDFQELIPEAKEADE